MTLMGDMVPLFWLIAECKEVAFLNLRYDWRNAIFDSRHRCDQSAHIDLVVDVDNAETWYLREFTDSSDVSMSVVLGCWCPCRDYILNTHAMVASHIGMQRLEGSSIAVGVRDELEEGFVGLLLG